MHHATLIVNPNAGTAHKLRPHWLPIQQLLASRGLEADLRQTTPEPDSARQLAAEAAERSDLVLACGGDGTVHGVIQGIANTSACLGVLPFGTANALARNLRLPTDPIAALAKLLTFTPRELPLGVAETQFGVRRFLVMAGAGPDGRLVHEMHLAAKARIGRSAYYAEAARIFLLRSFPTFLVTYRAVASENWSSLPAVALMASRIPDLGGLFRGLTSDCRLHHPHLVIKILRAPASISLPAWLALARSGLRLTNPWLTTLEVDEVRCSTLPATPATYAQVDGEPAGSLPLSITVEPKALRLLMPNSAAPEDE